MGYPDTTTASVAEMVSASADPAPHAVRRETGWEDRFGAIGPAKPGLGPRQDPVGDFPTGPAPGERLPEIVATADSGEVLDVEADRAGRPAVVVFYRSAVW